MPQLKNRAAKPVSIRSLAGGSVSGSPLGGMTPPPGPDERFLGPPSITPPPGGDPRYLGPPSIVPSPGPPGGGFVGPPDVTPGGGGGFLGPPSISPPGGGFVGPPNIGPAIPPPGGGFGGFVGPPDITPDQRFVGPPDITPDERFVGPPSMTGGASPLSPDPQAGSSPARGSFAGLTTTGFGNAPGIVPANQMATGFGNAPGILTEDQMEMLSGYAPEQVAELERLLGNAFADARRQKAEGPIEQGDQTQNPVMYAREYRKAIKQGLSPQQAAQRANQIIGGRSKYGERLNDIEDFLVDRHSTEDYIRRVIQAGQEGRGPLAQGGGGGGGGGGFGGGETGGPQHPGNTPPGIFGESGQQGIDFGTSPFSQMIEGYLGGLIGEGGQPLSGFARSVRDALGGQFAALTPQPGGTEFTTENALVNLIRGGVAPNPDVISRRLESEKDRLDQQRLAQQRQIDASLAARGMGNSGATVSSYENLERDLGAQYASAFRDIVSGELERARGTFEQALGLGESGRQANQSAMNQILGLAQSGAQADTSNLLQALGQASGHQNLTTQAALQLLQMNQAAAQFAAQFGLEREQLQHMLSQQNIMNLLPLIQQYLSAAGIAQRGSI